MPNYAKNVKKIDNLRIKGPQKIVPVYILNMTLLNAISLLGACNPITLCSTTNQNTQFIGYFVETTDVQEETWYRIDEEEEEILFAADAAGRDISINFDQNGNPILFYKAVPGLGKITGIKEIRNDYGSLVYMVNRLSDYAENTYESEDADDDILGYIRSFNSSYCGFKWNLVAGAINDDFVASLRNAPHDLLGFEDYFLNFVNRGPNGYGELNTTYHSSPNQQVNKIGVIDELNQDNTIDVIHMFATLDGIWNTYIYEDYSLNRSQHYCSDIEDLCGWAGDLQSEVQRQYEYVQAENGQYNTDFETILSGYQTQDGQDTVTNLPVDDYIADQDALNIASIHGNGSLASISLTHPYRYSLSPNLGNIDIYTRKLFADSFYNYVTSWNERAQ